MKSLPKFKCLYSSKFSRVYFLRTFKHLGLRVYVQIQKCLQRLHKWLLQPKKCANTIMSVTIWGMYRYKNICYNLKDIRIQNVRYILRYVLSQQCLLQSERRRMNTSMSVTVHGAKKFMGPTWGPPGSYRPQMGPCWPHEPCYQGDLLNTTKITPVTDTLNTK